MKNRFVHFRAGIFFLTVFNLFIIFCNSGLSQTRPCLNNGKKWRIGYYEGGAYTDYVDTMATLIGGLMELGWIPPSRIPVINAEKPKPYWDWLVKADSPYLSFSPEDAYSAGWNPNRRKQIKKTVLEKLQSGYLDLILAMGTWAGMDLANNRHHVPTMVLSASDPLRSGIIKSIHDSGYDHVTARVDPDRFQRQLRMFHRVVGFKRLGVAYEDTVDGKIYSAMHDVMEISKERGFDVITCKVIDDHRFDLSDETCINCFRYLAENSNAIYVTSLTCIPRTIDRVVEILRVHKIPSFSMDGSQYVKDGLMMSISTDAGFKKQGIFNAGKIARILNGKKPRKLDMYLPENLDVAVNMKTVKQIGFEMPESIIKIANEIYGD